MHEQSPLRLGIDLGGTKTEIIALAADGRELLRRRIATPRHDYHATIAAVVELVTGAEAELGTRGSVGMAIPGAVSPASGLIKNANSTWLNGQPLDRDLAEALGRTVRLANDANCLAVSESVDGAATDGRVVFGVILGTGTGGGICIDGRPWAGRNAIAGEWGHNPLPSPEPDELPGPECWCGRRGCIETWLSGPGLAADHRRRTGEALTAEAIAGRAEAGDQEAVFTLERHHLRLARSLASVINLLDPDVIVLGGGLSNLEAIYTEVPRLWSRWVFSDRVDTPLRRARHGDSSGVRGAAWLWPGGDSTMKEE